MRFNKHLFYLFLLLSSACTNTHKNDWAIIDSESVQIPLDSNQKTDSRMNLQQTIAPYKIIVDSMMNQELGNTDVEIFKNKPNGSLNNLTADMVLEISRQYVKDEKLRPDICLLNYGGLRNPLPKGKITLADIYQLMPFENEIVVLKLSGVQLDSMFQYIIDSEGQPLAGCVLIARSGKLKTALINGKPFDNQSVYNIATSDYLADGGDKMTFFKNPIQVEKTGLLVRNAMIEYIQQKSEKGEIIKANLEKRIILE